MNKINAIFIRTFSPCDRAIIEFEKNYPDFNGSLSDLLLLDKVTYDDKVWLSVKVAPLKVLQLWSVECAESVLHIYENEFPNDSRVRDCLAVTRKVLNGELTESAAWSAESAAWSAESAARSARSAARSAAWSEKDQEDKNLAILGVLLDLEIT
jgi:hypothetical protein